MNTKGFPNFQEAADIRALRFRELPGPLRLDSYQRPYVWGAGKAEQLLEDLRDHASAHGYYMGTLLLHQPDRKNQENGQALNVIDGQQRLTTLALLHRALRGELPKCIEFKFRSTISHRHIREVNKAIRDRTDSENKQLRTVLCNLTFTVVVVNQEDLAFTFFDTQNSRGVPLATTDLLKAFHLRSVGGSRKQGGEPEQVSSREQIEKFCARRWEALQVSATAHASEQTEDFAPELFHYYLWRARNWRGQHTLLRESRDQVLDTFQKRTVLSEWMEAVPLYPAPGNRLARHLTLDASGKLWLAAGEFRLSGDPAPGNRLARHLTLDASGKLWLAAGEFRLSGDPAELPFTLRQPIHRGLGFFLYTARYAALARRLFHEVDSSDALEQYRDFHDKVVVWNSPYLRQLHRLAVLMYYDQFAEYRLLPFSWALEYVLGAIRLTKQRVFQRSATKYLEEARLNLLDVIAGAYRPEEVFEFLLRPHHRVGENRYLKDAYAKRPAGNGVQGRYYDQMWGYFVNGNLSGGLEYKHFARVVGDPVVGDPPEGA